MSRLDRNAAQTPLTTADRIRLGLLPDRHQERGARIARLAHDVGLAVLGFAYLLALVAIVSLAADFVGVLS